MLKGVFDMSTLTWLPGSLVQMLESSVPPHPHSGLSF